MLTPLLNNNKIGILMTVIFVAMLFSSCSTPMHSFTVKAPAKFGIVVKSLKVEPLNTSSRHGRQYAEHLKGIVENYIANEGYITIAYSNPQTVLRGNVIFGKIKRDSYTKKWKRNGKTHYTYHYVKKLTVSGNYSLIDFNMNNTLVGESFEVNYEKEWSSSENRSKAKAKVFTNERIYSDVLQQIAYKMVSEISPHREIVKRQLQESGDSNIKLGIKYLKNGRTDQALSIWDGVIKNTDNGKDKAAAYYNIGVVKESQGLYRDAFELFSNANSLDLSSDLYMNAMTRVENAKRLKEKLESQVQ